MKLTALLLFALLITSAASAQLVPYKQWSYTYNNGAADNSMHGIATDSQGNAYYACRKPSNIGWPGVYIMKYNSEGAFQYVKSFEPPHNRGVHPREILTDNSNNVYIAGYADSTYELTGFLAKFNSNGDTLWSRYLGMSDTNISVVWLTAAADNSGNIYVSGMRMLDNPYRLFIYTAKYSTTGELLWLASRPLSGNGVLAHFAKSHSVVDGAGNLVVSHTYSVNSMPGDPNSNILTLKYSPSGSEVWFSSYNTPGDRSDFVQGIDFDSQNNIYLAGICDISLGGSNTVSEFACIKLDGASGSTAWAYKTRGSYTSYYYGYGAYGVAVNRSTNEVYLAGIVYNNFPESKQGTIVKLSSGTGMEAWKKSIPHIGDEALYNIKLGTDGNLYVNGTIDYAGIRTLYSAKYSSAGDVLWSAKYVPGGLVGTCFLALGPQNSMYGGGFIDGSPDDLYISKYIQVTPATQSFTRSINLPIMDFQTAYDTIEVAGLPPSAVITGIEFKIDTLLHPVSYDISAVLTSPQGTVDTVMRNPGRYAPNPGADIINCAVTDTASRSLDSIPSPLTGYWRPFSPLSVFQGYNPNGKWILSMFDSFNGSEGTLKKYSLKISYYDPNSVGIQTVSNKIPESHMLSQNYPNPFNPVTNIKFQVPQAGNVTLKVYNTAGKEVATLVNERKAPGVYLVDFNAGSLSSGVYFYRLQTESFVETKKMVLIK
jgi:subtilisin-like proprotein convertase family protein